jgi:hypothetical protein
MNFWLKLLCVMPLCEANSPKMFHKYCVLCRSAKQTRSKCFKSTVCYASLRKQTRPKCFKSTVCYAAVRMQTRPKLGEMSVGKSTVGDSSSGQIVHWAKCLLGESSVGESSPGETSLGESSYNRSFLLSILCVEKIPLPDKSVVAIKQSHPAKQRKRPE